MKKYLIVFLLIAVSCSPRKVLLNSEKTDSVRIVNRTEYIEVVKWDTVKIGLPVEVKNTAAMCDSSYLETTLAVSTAVMSGGVLFHTLENKTGSFSVPVAVTEKTQREVIEEKRVNTAYVEEPVPMPPTKLQRFFYFSGIAAWLALFFFLFFRLNTALKRIRRRLMSQG